MSNNPVPGDIVSKVYGQAMPSHAVPSLIPIKSFFPWHLPRKQWIRRKQWAHQVLRLYRDGGIGSDRPFRYLSLPGSDLIDIEVLAEACQQKGTSLRYLGFHSGLSNPEERARIAIAERATGASGGINERSKTVNFDILSLSSPNCSAWRHVKEFESFDAINLDICEFFANRPHRSSHRAVQQLLEFQLNSRHKPWLLFITTTCDLASIPSSDIESYVGLYQANVAAAPKFQAALEACVDAQISPAIEDIRGLFQPTADSRFAKLLTVGIGKWLASCVRDNNWRVQMPSVISYRRGLAGGDFAKIPSYPELVSLAFVLTPPTQKVRDPTPFGPDSDLVKGREFGKDDDQPLLDREADNECVEIQSAIAMIAKVQRMLDLDLHLQHEDHQEERKNLTEETTQLLRVRNYDVAEYQKWVNAIALL